jgi:hypothetical protein
LPRTKAKAPPYLGAVGRIPAEDGTDPYFGVGAEYSNLYLGAHWARFDLDDIDVDVIELRVGWKF